MGVFTKTETLSHDKFYEVSIDSFGLEDLEQIEASIKVGDNKSLIKVLASIIDKDSFPTRTNPNTNELVADIGELVTGDFRNLVLWARMRTLDSTTMKLQFKCSDEKECKYVDLNHEFDINEFERKEMDESLELENELELSDGSKVFISLEKMKHADAVEKLAKKLPNANKQMLKYVVLTRFENKLFNEIERYNFMKDPKNIKIGKEIKDFIVKKCFFGVIPISFIKCPRCGRVSQIRLNFRADFFDTSN